MSPLVIGFIIIILLLFIWNIAEFAYVRTEKYKQRLGDVRKFVEGVPDGLDICNIGSGPGYYAISYDYCDKKGFNFSTTPQNYKYGFRILDKYKQKINRNAIIIIIIMCPLSFGNNKDYLRKGYSDKYYYFLEKEQIDHYSSARAVLLKRPLLAAVVKKMRAAVRHLKPMYKTDHSSPSVIKTWEAEFELHDLKDASQSKAHQSAFDEKIDILKDGIENCRSRSWRPLLVIPPIPAETRQQIGKDFMDRFVYDNLQRLRNEVGDIQILDYFDDSRFSDDTYYQNDIFMNEMGSQVFSRILFADIEGGLMK